MHDGMTYDPIQGQGQGASEVPKIALFKVSLMHHLQCELPNDHRFLNWNTISKFVRVVFLISYFLCLVTMNLEGSLRLVHPRRIFFQISMKFQVDD